MIGLGSNRLTCCRRGGMSVTQAGRGGMEWLAGVRGVSPYSAQATAALKAAFTAAQWQTIRDYGFAHPEIVGYMNAYAPEDAKIAYSLVEGIGTRWLVGDGTAYINSGYHPMTKSTKIRTKVKVTSQTNSGKDGIFGCRVSASSKRYNIFFNGDTQQARYDWAQTDSTYTQYNIAANTAYELEIKAGYVKINDSVIVNFSYNKETYDANLYIFANNNNGTAVISKDAHFAFVEIGEGDSISENLVPYKKNGAMGMIDLLTGTFYGNANSSGSFSESIESPS